MSHLVEHDVIQNIGIGALALHRFTISFTAQKQNIQGPSLASSFVVLPLLYHEATLNSIYNKQMKTAFSSATIEYREMPAGLQGRMEDMSDQTFKSLTLAFCSKLLTYDKTLNELRSVTQTLNTNQYNSDIKKIVKGADRIGYWFATMPLDQICLKLKIKF